MASVCLWADAGRKEKKAQNGKSKKSPVGQRKAALGWKQLCGMIFEVRPGADPVNLVAGYA